MTLNDVLRDLGTKALVGPFRTRGTAADFLGRLSELERGQKAVVLPPEERSGWHPRIRVEGSGLILGTQ